MIVRWFFSLQVGTAFHRAQLENFACNLSGRRRRAAAVDDGGTVRSIIIVFWKRLFMEQSNSTTDSLPRISVTLLSAHALSTNDTVVVRTTGIERMRHIFFTERLYNSSGSRENLRIIRIQAESRISRWVEYDVVAYIVGMPTFILT